MNIFPNYFTLIVPGNLLKRHIICIDSESNFLIKKFSKESVSLIDI